MAGFVTEEPDLVDNSERVWIWRNWIPHHQVTIVSGDSSVGKSRTIASVLKSLVSQEPFPDGEFPTIQPCHVLLVNTESDKLEVSDTYAAQGWDASDLLKLHILREVQNGPIREAFDIDNPKHLEALASEVHKHKAGVIILDPLIEFHHRNTIKDQEIRNLMVKLRSLANTWRVAIICMVHWNKNEKQSYGARMAGSHQLTASVRAVINLWHERDGLRTFHLQKHSNAPDQPDLSYKIEAPDGMVIWGKSAVSQDPKLLQAEDWLKTYLPQHGELTIEEVLSISGFSERTMRRARHNLDLDIYTKWKVVPGSAKQIAHWGWRSEANLWGLGSLKTHMPGSM